MCGINLGARIIGKFLVCAVENLSASDFRAVNPNPDILGS